MKLKNLAEIEVEPEKMKTTSITVSKLVKVFFPIVFCVIYLIKAILM